MGGEAEISLPQPYQTQIPSSDNRRGGGAGRVRFPVGSSVEVRTDEEDFRGVYFSATVIEPPANSSKKGSKKKPKGLYVEYDNLLAREDGSDRLKEYVPVSFVRPVPPLQEIVKGFEPDETVDAFYKDGWWTGVVSRVVEAGKKFIVTFQNPPDELPFGIDELRAHWDWVNGSWVRPQKQSIAGLMFDVGRKVEVSFDREDFQDAWFPATIQQDLGNGVFLVEYSGANMEKATVDSLHIRPCPPLLKDKNFVLLEKVDAFFDFGWWSGVITKELENSKYIVFFKQMKQDKEFNQSELRPHMEWKDGKWFTSSQLSQEASIPSSDDGVHEQNTSENSSASAATAPSAPVKTSVGEKDTCDGKAPSSLTSTEGHSEQVTHDNQKMSHVTTSLTKRRQYLSDPGTALSQPLKKLKEGHVVGANQQDGHDKPIEEVSCGLGSPDSVNNMETSATQTTKDESSSNPAWGKNILKKQRNIRAKQNSMGETMSKSSSMKKSSTQVLPPEVGEKEPDAAENTQQHAQNENAKEGTDVPIIIGLRCVETGSSGVGISGGKRSQRPNSKENLNDQEQQLNNSASQKIKDSTPSEIGKTTEKRKRGRPKKIVVESTQTPVSGGAEDGDVGSGYLSRKDDGLQRSPDAEVMGTEASMFDQEMAFSKEKLANGQSDPKNREARTIRRTLPRVHAKKGVKESVVQAENRSWKRGRIGITREMIAAQVQDYLAASGGKTMDVNRPMEVEKVVGEVPSNEFENENEPLSKWIEEMQSTSRPSSEATLERCMANGEKQRYVTLDEVSDKHPETGGQASALENTVGVVLDKDSEKQPESQTQASVLVDLNSIVPSEPHSLPAVENTVSVVLDEDSEKQPESGTQAPVLVVDQSSIVSSEPQSLPSLKSTDGVVLDERSERQPESETQASALVVKGSIVPSEPESLPFVKNTCLWNTIESMEVFQKLPQKPHFQPLERHKASTREGLAIGYMVTFASLVEKASKLQLNDPQSTIDDITETLTDLEKYGFDVRIVQDHVTKLLAVKDKEEKLTDEVNNLNNRLLGHNQTKSKIEEEIHEINEQIRKLQEKLSLVESEKEKEDDEIAFLEARLKVTEESIKSLRSEGIGSIL